MNENREKLARDQRSPMPDVIAQERRDIEQLTALDPETLDGEYHYRWVMNHPHRIARHKLKGYTLVSQEEGVKTLSDILDDDGSGRVTLGDLVLMKCPKERYIARRKSNRRFSEARMAAPKQQFKNRAKKRGSKTIEQDRFESSEDDES